MNNRKKRFAGLVKKYPMAVDTISFPVRYDEKGQSVWDADNMMVCDVRGWSRIQFRPLPEKRQDEIGLLIAELLNDLGRGVPAHLTTIPENEQRKLTGEELDLFI